MEASLAASGEHRLQSLGEEIANSVSHGIGLMAALIGSPVLIWAAVRKGDPVMVTAVSVFATSMVLLYLSSMLYHGLARNRAKRVFLVLDHVAIFLLIAGTYTPFALGVLRGALGWTLLAMIWSVALLGIITQLVPRLRHSKLSLTLYLSMGWMILLVIRPLCQHLPLEGLLWVVAGGLFYTLGVIFYVAPSRYCHFVWHLFTIAGTTCHYFAILWYAV